MPYWIDVQTEYLHASGTRVVAPLRRVRPTSKYAERRNPVYTVESAKVFLDAANVATFPANHVSKHVSNLTAHRLDIDNALDFLSQGI